MSCYVGPGLPGNPPASALEGWDYRYIPPCLAGFLLSWVNAWSWDHGGISTHWSAMAAPVPTPTITCRVQGLQDFTSIGCFSPFFIFQLIYWQLITVLIWIFLNKMTWNTISCYWPSVSLSWGVYVFLFIGALAWMFPQSLYVAKINP